jgi:hypothetical protein
MTKAIVYRLRRDIDRHKASVRSTPDRHQRIQAIEQLLRDLDRVVATIGTNQRALPSLLRQGSLQALGELMSPSGMERFVGTIGWGVDDDEIDAVDKRRGRGDITSFDDLTRQTRMSVAADIGPKLIVGVLKTIAAPLRQLLVLEKSNKGGRPQDLYRNYVVQELALAWEAEHGKQAPGGKTGPFVEQCREVLEELGLSTDGLADCIGRTTKRLRATHTRRGQNSA